MGKYLNPEKGSKLADAVTYAKNQKTSLCAFVQHGDVPISNNLAENAIRPFAVGRKNWLFCDTVKGAESSAVVYSMVETAKAAYAGSVVQASRRSWCIDSGFMVHAFR